MVEVLTAPEVSLDALAKQSLRRSANAPAWLRSMKDAALDRYLEVGLPTTRDEEWRFTNVAPIASGDFQLASREGVRLSADQLKRFDIPGLDAFRIVFVDGIFQPGLSNISGLPRGVEVKPLAEMWESRRELIEPHVTGHKLHADKADVFALLNSACVDDGLFIHVARNIVVERPIEILTVTATTASSDAPGVFTNPRTIIVAEESSQCTIIERYVSLRHGQYFTNAVTDIDAAPNANVTHYLIEEECKQSFNISTLRTRQASSSNCTSHTVLLGGRLVRNNVHAILDGEPTECLINGLYVGGDAHSGGGQHMDNHMRVEHAKPHGDSRQFYKGILDGKASAVFSGRIIVHKDAQKTDAKQTNKNLLLSDDAHVDTKPQLEIYADDVKCTHGATIGQLDEQAIFYLRARGLSNDAARSLLIHAFAGESLERMKLEPVRNYLDRILIKRLPGGEMLRHILED